MSDSETDSDMPPLVDSSDSDALQPHGDSTEDDENDVADDDNDNDDDDDDDHDAPLWEAAFLDAHLTMLMQRIGAPFTDVHRSWLRQWSYGALLRMMGFVGSAVLFVLPRNPQLPYVVHAPEWRVGLPNALDDIRR